MDCTIRPWRLDDAKELALIANNKKIQNNLRDGLPYPYTEEDAESYIGELLSSDKNTTFAFAITINDKVVGSIGVFRKDNVHFRTAEMGYYIAEEFWGKGLGASAVRQICEYIFAEPFAYNIASCRILEKSGFQYEGTLRSNAVKNGQVLDMKMYSLIKSDIEQ